MSTTVSSHAYSTYLELNLSFAVSFTFDIDDSKFSCILYLPRVNLSFAVPFTFDNFPLPELSDGQHFYV